MRMMARKGCESLNEPITEAYLNRWLRRLVWLMPMAAIVQVMSINLCAARGNGVGAGSIAVSLAFMSVAGGYALGRSQSWKKDRGNA